LLSLDTKKLLRVTVIKPLDQETLLINKSQKAKILVFEKVQC
jgi:TPP-dependent indolepyruvate ferredoxin oxidoreductase alpha subunit